MKRHAKKDYPLHLIRRHLEPGPVVLVSSAWKGKTNIMTMGWHMMMEFTPALFGCIISNQNHSFTLIRNAGECVVNVPTVELADTVAQIGNSTGGELDKFAAFGLTPARAAIVEAPLIAECYASFECRLYDGSQIEKYNFFIWEVVKAHVAPTPKYPRTIHYKGEGEFRVAGDTVSLRKRFRADYL
ncbi:MAG: flavin reductase family protein [Alphaproteobacteria bacterium]|nr:flavin reductase family protein [Alphaproteobacteria bacterium]